jgi:hypothetical protein
MVRVENVLSAVARRQHGQYVLNGQPPAANDRFAAEDRGIGRDATDQLRLVRHDYIISALTPHATVTHLGEKLHGVAAR